MIVPLLHNLWQILEQKTGKLPFSPIYDPHKAKRELPLPLIKSPARCAAGSCSLFVNNSLPCCALSAVSGVVWSCLCCSGDTGRMIARWSVWTVLIKNIKHECFGGQSQRISVLFAPSGKVQSKSSPWCFDGYFQPQISDMHGQRERQKKCDHLLSPLASYNKQFL